MDYSEQRQYDRLIQVEHIIQIKGTFFEVLISVHKMIHLKDNVYEDPKGKTWHLTKYGFEPNVRHSVKHELTMSNIKNKNLEAFLTAANKKIENQRDLLVRNSKTIARVKKELKTKQQ